MGTVALVIFLFILPCAWFFWTSMDLKSGKKNKVHWKISLSALIAVILISVIANYYFSDTYKLSFFQNGFESVFALIVCAAFLLVIVIINFIVSRIFKGAPKSFHNPEKVWIFTAVFCTTILFFIMWVYPLAEKASYIHKVENALAMSEQQQDPEEITVLFMNSEKKCLGKPSNCTNDKFSNSFFLKNNLETQKEVQVRIRALGSEQQELKVIESDIMTLEAGELRLVETEETFEKTSIWSRSSFETNRRVHSYESLYRYRNAD